MKFKLKIIRKDSVLCAYNLECFFLFSSNVFETGNRLYIAKLVGC